MIDLSNGIHIVHSLVQQSLTGNTEPFLTSSRLVEDLRQIKQRLAMGIARLTPDDLTALFPVALFLQGYEVVGEDMVVGHHFWITSLRRIGIRVSRNSDDVIRHPPDGQLADLRLPSWTGGCKPGRSGAKFSLRAYHVLTSASFDLAG